MKSQTKKQLIRIFLASLVSLALLKITDLSPALNVLMFFFVYIAVSMVIEWVIKLFHKQKSKK